MRTIHDPQMKFGAVDIAAIELDLKSRDDIPPILRGLQYIYATPALRAAVFKVLERVMPSRSGPGLSNEDRHRKADPRLGRPGMEQWKILVLGVLRLGLNSDYDRIHELANHHDTIRQMLGHGGWEDKTTYNRQTIKDNLRLFTPEILDEINQLVVKAGHGLVKKNAPKAGPTRIRTEKKIELHDSTKALRARCDSFVVETDVHIRPTSTCSSTPYVRRLKNASDFHRVTSWRAGDNIGTTSGSSKSSIVSSKSSGPPLRKLSK